MAPAFGAVTAVAEPAQPSLVKKSNVADWFYIPSWKRTSHPQPAKDSVAERWLVFVDQCGLGWALIEGLERRGHDVITVEVGEKFRSEHHRTFTIDPRRPSDYMALLEELRPRNVLHLWGVTASGQSELATDAQFLDFRSLLFLAQAIGDAKLTDPVDITIISHHQQDVTGEEMIFPEKALTLAPCKVIPLEYPNVHCRNVDVVFSYGRKDPRLVEQLLDEVESSSSDQVVAYRGPHRWVPIVEPVQLTPPAVAAPRLKKHGVYLITGGLGKIGFTIAEYLAKTAAAKLILTTRSAHPHSEVKLRELEALGAEVMVLMADVANQEEMQAAVSRAQAKYGPINGVIHSAGVLGDRAIQQKTQNEVDQVLRPKVIGTVILDNIFANAPLDFFVLFSSLSAVKPGFGQVAYSAANNYLDAFVHSNAVRKHRFVTCINWDVWQGEGMAYDAAVPLALQRLKEADFAQRGILPDEGIDVFHRVLGSTYPHIMVSTSDYLKSDHRDLLQLYLDWVKKANPSHDRHARASLSSTYVPPANETEERLAQIWQELLGIAAIGAEDNFLELGGDSLIGTQLITRLKTSFGVKLPIKSVYLHPTIQSMATAVEEALISQSSLDTLEEALRKVEGLEQKPRFST